MTEDAESAARKSVAGEEKIAPITADVERCEKAVALFMETAAHGDSPAQRYRNVAHAYRLVSMAVTEYRENARSLRHDALKAAAAKKLAEDIAKRREARQGTSLNPGAGDGGKD